MSPGAPLISKYVNFRRCRKDALHEQSAQSVYVNFRRCRKGALHEQSAQSVYVNFRRCRLAIAALVSAMSLATVGCATASDKLEKRLKVGEPVSRVYSAKYEDVEAAIKQAMIRYPQRVDNTEAGIFETDFVKGEARFRSPVLTTEFSPGYRYRLLVRLVRGKNDEKPAVKVLVTKLAEIARDFFSQPDPVASDGLEENVILYRIGREIVLARAMAKATDSANKKADEKNQQLD